MEDKIWFKTSKLVTDKISTLRLFSFSQATNKVGILTSVELLSKDQRMVGFGWSQLGLTDANVRAHSGEGERSGVREGGGGGGKARWGKIARWRRVDEKSAHGGRGD